MWFFSAMNNYTATKSLGLIVVKLADMLLLDEKVTDKLSMTNANGDSTYVFGRYLLNS